MNEVKVNIFSNAARWFASLSNGENAVEGTGKFEEIAGELSPWQKLAAYIKEKKLTITGMQIRIDGRVYTLPSVEPKFGGEVPKSYKYFRKIAGDMGSDNPTDIEIAELHICIQAVYSTFVVSLWVDEMGKKDCWVSINKNK